MGIHVKLRHTTRYTYDRPVSLSPQIVRLRPAPHSRTPVLSYSLDVRPKGHFVNWQQDPQGNWLARLVFPEKVDELVVDVDLVAEMSIVNPFDFFLEEAAESFPFAYDPALDHELRPFLLKEAAGPLLAAYVAAIPRRPTPTTDFLVGLNQRLQRDIGYTIRMEPGVQTPEETLAKRTGSCRDSAWLLVQVLRHLGLAARFVSGYLIQLVPDVKAIDGPVGGGRLHRPARLDRSLPARRRLDRPGPHLRPADRRGAHSAGRPSPDPGSAAPITGAVEKCEVTFAHHMEVTRCRRRRASPSPMPTTNGRRCWPWASRWTPGWPPATSA